MNFFARLDIDEMYELVASIYHQTNIRLFEILLSDCLILKH